MPDEFDAALHADDFCALLAHKPAAARQHLSTAIQRNRAANNPNRLYFDPKTGSPAGLYIQLLRPWMAEQNAAGTHDWRVVQYEVTDHWSRLARAVEIVNTINCPQVYVRGCGQVIRLVVIKAPLGGEAHYVDPSGRSERGLALESDHLTGRLEAVYEWQSTETRYCDETDRWVAGGYIGWYAPAHEVKEAVERDLDGRAICSVFVPP